MKKLDKTVVKKFIKKYLIGELLVFIAILVLDLVLKAVMANADPNHIGIEIIPNVLSFRYVENRGAAFSMLKDKMWLFIVLASIAVVGFSVFLFFKRKGSKFLTYTITVLIAGTLGNLIDRIAFGFVRDFIDINIFVCNIADIALTVGAILLCVYYIFIYKDKPKIQKVEIPEGEAKAEDDNPITGFHMDTEDEETIDYSSMKVEEEPFNMSEIASNNDEESEQN